MSKGITRYPQKMFLAGLEKQQLCDMAVLYKFMMATSLSKIVKYFYAH